MTDLDTIKTLREILNVSDLSFDVLEILGDHKYMYSKIDRELDEAKFRTFFEVPNEISCMEFIENRNNNSMEDLTKMGFTWEQASRALNFVE